MLNFIKQHSAKFIIGILVIALLIISVKKNPLVKELAAQNAILEKEKQEVIKERQVYKDSVQILYNLAQKSEAKDTFIVIEIQNNKEKTNEEINNILNLSVDSNIKFFYKVTELYHRTRFLQDSL